MLATKLGSRLTAFYAAPVYAPPYWPGEPMPFYDPSFADEYKKTQAETAKRYLGIVVRHAQTLGVKCETCFVTHNVAYEAIIQAAQENNCDLIVMASHGRRGIGALVLGSETQKVLTHCTVPVLVHR